MNCVFCLGFVDFGMVGLGELFQSIGSVFVISLNDSDVHFGCKRSWIILTVDEGLMFFLFSAGINCA